MVFIEVGCEGGGRLEGERGEVCWWWFAGHDGRFRAGE